MKCTAPKQPKQPKSVPRWLAVVAEAAAAKADALRQQAQEAK
jgi:hypothetical protein